MVCDGIAGGSGSIRPGMSYGSYRSKNAEIRTKSAKGEHYTPHTHMLPGKIGKQLFNFRGSYNMGETHLYADDKGNQTGFSFKGTNLKTGKDDWAVYDNETDLLYSVSYDKAKNLYEETQRNGKFNRIESADQYAVDENGDGIVQENEIHSNNEE